MIVLLEIDPNVCSFRTEPYSIFYKFGGQTHRYVPDIEIKYTSGAVKLVEVKPMYQLDYPINISKFEYAKEYCNNRNMSFVILTESEINQAVAKQGELLGSLSSVIAEYGNQQPSPSKKFPIFGIVDGKVQRLTDEDTSTDKSDTSALLCAGHTEMI